MATTAERLDDLETAVTQLQGEMLLKSKLGEVKTIVSAVETRLDTNDTNHTTINDRLSKLERWVTSIRSAIQGLNEDGNAITDNLSASAAPAATDDGTEGYSVGSHWINTTADTAYICCDATTDTAVWKQVTP